MINVNRQTSNVNKINQTLLNPRLTESVGQDTLEINFYV